jgi:hypothetical protein
MTGKPSHGRGHWFDPSIAHQDFSYIYIYIYIHLGFQPVTRDARQIWRRRQVCDHLVRRLDWEEPQPMTSYFDLKNVVAD